MLEEKIIEKRKKLNESIEKNTNYDMTYKLSVELDDLISQFYKKKEKKKKKEKYYIWSNKSCIKI